MVTLSTTILLLLSLGVFGIGFSLGWLLRMDALGLLKKRSKREVQEPKASAEK